MSSQKVYVVDLTNLANGHHLDKVVRTLKRSSPDEVVFKRNDDTTGQSAIDEIAMCGIAIETKGGDWNPPDGQYQNVFIG